MADPNRHLFIHDGRGHAMLWTPVNPQGCADALWAFVGDHLLETDNRFTVLDALNGSSLVLWLNVGVISRRPTLLGAEQFWLTDEPQEFQDALSMFVHGGVPALDLMGEWFENGESLDRAIEAKFMKPS